MSNALFIFKNIYSGEQKSKTFNFFLNDFFKIELYLSSNISLKRAQKIILDPLFIDLF